MANYSTVETSVEVATRLIRAAQRELGRKLNGAERTELLKDQTNWTPATVAAIVTIVAHRRVI